MVHICGHCFHVKYQTLFVSFIRLAWSTITLFSLCKGTTDNTLTLLVILLAILLAILLVQVEPTTFLTPDVPAAAGNAKPTSHRFDAELSLMFFDKDTSFIAVAAAATV